ncbi:hypothetical protein ECZU23_53980 [Escherichia coli]|nr:hypothetical protein ECZU23_53980 [Escherichia coli]
MFARQGEVMNPLQYVPFNQTLYFINGDDPAQVARMKRRRRPHWRAKLSSWQYPGDAESAGQPYLL